MLLPSDMQPNPGRARRVLTSIWTQRALRLLFGGIFIAAAVGKIGHGREFAAIIAGYHLFPPVLINLAALILPWLELFTALFLICGIWVRSAALLLCLLLLAFLTAITINLFRGMQMACGCFSTNALDLESPLVLLLRDIAILAPGILILAFHPSKTTKQ